LSSEHEVIIVGGGPAGSTAASLLAREGHDVLLFEKERFPRDHVGESMLPFCFPLFRDLGVLDQMRRMFVRKPGVRFIDRNGEASTSWCFKHVIHDETYLSFQVDRSKFDLVLLDNARRLGATVHEETRATSVDLSDPERVAVETLDHRGDRELHSARFVIDASGRDAMVGSRNGWRTPREELDRTALWSHWTGVSMKGGLEEGLSLIIYMGEDRKGWIWVFPLTPDRITAGVVMNNSYIREQKRLLLDQGSTDWQHDLCMQELNLSPFVRSLLAGAERALPILVNGNYSYEVKNHFGPNYAMIGDARGFIDPIFSSGVFLSIKTAYLVTEALRARLAGQPDAGELMSDAYEKVTGAYNFVHRMIRLFYNPHAVTWAQVGEGGDVHRAHQSAMAAGHFMLSGDFFENHSRYNKFFGLLEDPFLFRLYARTVIERPDLNTSSCDTPWHLAFGEVEESPTTAPV
jgi:flavin-dependent dehydrogenase